MQKLKEILNLDKKDYSKYINNFERQNKSPDYFCPQDNKTVFCQDFIGKNTRVVTGYSHLVLDDDLAYELLFNEVKKAFEGVDMQDKKLVDDIVAKVIQQTVFDYYGIGKPDDMLRTQVYKSAYEREQDVSISNFRNSGNSMCLERSCLAHNYFKLLGYNSTLVASQIKMNGKLDLHTYGIVKLGGKSSIYDLICSKLTNAEMPSPVMTTLAQDEEQAVKQGKSPTSIDNINFKSQSGKENSITYIVCAHIPDKAYVAKEQ